MLAYLLIYEQTRTHYMSHFPAFAQMAALRSNSWGLIHLKLEEVLKDFALKTDLRRSGLQRTFQN